MLRLSLGVAVSLVALALLARTVSPVEVVQGIGRGNPIVLLPAVPLYFAGVWARSLRWQTLLAHSQVPLNVLFRGLVIGFTVNDLLPARLGELVRVLLLCRKSIPAGAALASIIAERALDGLVVTGFLIVGLGFVQEIEWLKQLAWASALAFVGLGLGLAATALAPIGIRRLALGMGALLPSQWRPRLLALVDGTIDAMVALAEWRRALRALALSAVAWTLEASMYFVIMLGFPVPGSLPAALLGTGVANLATLVPSSPGYIGTFDAALAAALVAGFGAVPAAALSYALVVHLALVLPVVAVGLVYIWQEGLTLVGLSRVAINSEDARALLGRKND